MATTDTKSSDFLTEQLPFLTPNEQDGLVTLTSLLSQRFGEDLLLVTLFGSKVRGDFDSESDVDILIVIRMQEKEYWQYWNEIVNIAWEVEATYNLVFSLVIKNEQDYAVMRKQPSLLARNIEQDGIVLWTKRPNEPTFKPT